MTNKQTIEIIEYSNKKANSLDSKTILELSDKFHAASQNEDIKVIVFQTGGEGAFCAGASFDEIKNLKDMQSAKALFFNVAKLLLAMVTCQKPIIAKVQGPAVGGGVGVIAAADYVIALESASVRLSELAIGLGAFVVEPFIVEKIGKANFFNMSQDCEERDSNYCLNNGLFAKVTKNKSDLDSEVQKKAEEFSNYNLKAYGKLKSIIWKNLFPYNELEHRAEISGKLALEMEFSD